MVCNLRDFKEFIDNEMITILGQMDSPTEIFEHVYLVRASQLRGSDRSFLSARASITTALVVSRALSGTPLIWTSCRAAGKRSVRNQLINSL